MDEGKIIKIIMLNVAIALIDIILFSPGIIGIEIGGTSILATAFGITVMLMSGVVFVFGNYKIIYTKVRIMQPGEIKSENDYITALKLNYGKRTFAKEIDIILEQIERLHKKKDTIKDILLQRFDSTEMSYSKFQGAVIDLDNIFYINIRSILNKLNAFDEEDYNQIKKDSIHSEFSKEFIKEKMDIYKEYITFVKDSVEDNEQILLKLDRFLLEISKFNSLEDGEIENMGAMKEIDELISNTKFYKK